MDHERSGAQEWQLPGYGRDPSQARKQLASQTVPQNTELARNIARNEPAPQQKTRSQAQTKVPSTTRNVPSATKASAAANSLRGKGASRGSRARGVARGSRGQLYTSDSRNPRRLFSDSPAKSSWRAGLEPTGMVKLPAPFGAFKYEFFGAARAIAMNEKSHVTKGRCEAFEDISQKTGAYVNPPSYTDRVIRLWGGPSQVAAAKDLLLRLIAKCNFTQASKKKTEWTKIRAHSEKKDATVELEERHEAMLQQLRREPDAPSSFAEKLLFLWPKEGPSMEESLGPQLEALDMLRARFGYPIFVPRGQNDYICVVGNNYDTIRQIVHCLRTKWSETIANSSIRSKAYVVELPGPSFIRNNVIVKNNARIAKPFLYGDPPGHAELARWCSRATLIDSRNNARILNAIDKSLRGIMFVRGHLRMRVNFGTFVLDHYRVPKDNKRTYSFEEFREMLLHEDTRGRLVPGLKPRQDELLSRCFKASNLLRPFESICQTLEKVEPAYSVNFEFLGSNNALLRLEAEFERRPGAQEYEIAQRRWLKPRKNGHAYDERPPLQVSTVDFQRSDWQIEIKSLDFQEASSIDVALRSFSHSIRFRRASELAAVSGKAQRKVTFPDSAPVSRFVEKSALRYRLRETKYIFELARYDEYSRTGLEKFRQGGPEVYMGRISETPSTSWGASIFNPDWDNLLGDQANLPVGRSAQWSPQFDTFFPPKGGKASDDGCAGFWEFIDLVRKVAELLGPAQTSSPQMVPADAAIEVETSSVKSKAARSHASSAESSQTDQDKKQLKRLLDGDLGTLF